MDSLIVAGFDMLMFVLFADPWPTFCGALVIVLLFVALAYRRACIRCAKAEARADWLDNYAYEQERETNSWRSKYFRIIQDRIGK